MKDSPVVVTRNPLTTVPNKKPICFIDGCSLNFETFFLSKEFVWDYKPTVLLGTTNFLLEVFDQQSKWTNQHADDEEDEDEDESPDESPDEHSPEEGNERPRYDPFGIPPSFTQPL